MKGLAALLSFCQYAVPTAMHLPVDVPVALDALFAVAVAGVRIVLQVEESAASAHRLCITVLDSNKNRKIGLSNEAIDSIAILAGCVFVVLIMYGLSGEELQRHRPVQTRPMRRTYSKQNNH